MTRGRGNRRCHGRRVINFFRSRIIFTKVKSRQLNYVYIIHRSRGNYNLNGNFESIIIIPH